MIFIPPMSLKGYLFSAMLTTGILVSYIDRDSLGGISFPTANARPLWPFA